MKVVSCLTWIQAMALGIIFRILDFPQLIKELGESVRNVVVLRGGMGKRQREAILSIAGFLFLSVCIEKGWPGIGL
ncbi:MAG: hypothetical protein U9N55_10030 [candidate division Zixibacteria bacterium]|nr:hypothetical protein [candidate division Zixibacteria bacterium]